MDYYYTEVVTDELTKFGLDVRTIEKATGLRASEFEKVENTAQLVSGVSDLIDDDGWGLRVGRRLNVSSHGIIGYALMTSATVHDLLKVLIQYNRLVTPDIKVELHYLGDEVALRAMSNGILNRKTDRFFMECFFASVHTCATFLLPHKPYFGTQQFSHPEPSYGQLYKEIFGRKLEFNAAASQLLIPAEALDTRLSMANPAAEVMFQEQCDEMLKQESKNKQLSNRVKDELFHRQGEFPRCVEVAENLHMSESSLRRKLKAEGTTFQELLDQVRKQLAYEYLNATRLPVAEVARLLGFDDTTNFRRAFRRWSGQTPSEYRNSL